MNATITISNQITGKTIEQVITFNETQSFCIPATVNGKTLESAVVRQSGEYFFETVPNRYYMNCAAIGEKTNTLEEMAVRLAKLYAPYKIDGQTQPPTLTFKANERVKSAWKVEKTIISAA